MKIQALLFSATINVGLIAVLCSLLLFAGGSRAAGEPASATRAFYYWKTVYQLSSADLDYLRDLRVGKVYVKFFDVDWFDDVPRGAFPVAPTRFNTPFPKEIEIVPTVFLTNAVVRRIRTEELPTLADQITQKIQRMAKAAKLPPIREIQLDCDWTGATRAAFFTLLQAVSDLMQPQQIDVSATIRLHQIKYADDMGIPPVTRGMLMCYNMGSPRNPDTSNAIFDLPLVKNYLAGVDRYPLPLDVALPLFSWGVVYRRDRFIMLINNARKTDLASRPEFEIDSDGMYLAKDDTLVNGQDLFKGERLRVDEASLEELLELTRFLAGKMANRPFSAAFFHYDPALLTYYGAHELEQIYLPFETTVQQEQR